MGDATSHLPAWTGAGWRTDYPWLPNWTLAEGFEWSVTAIRHRGLEIEGTALCAQVIHSASGQLAVDWTTPGSPAAVTQMMPTRDQVRYLQALLMVLAWSRESSGQGYYNNASILHNGTTTNVQTIGPFDLVSASGKQVTFTSGATDLRHVSIGTAAGTIGPFDQLRFSGNSVVALHVIGLIKRVVNWGSGAGTNVTVELLQDVSAAATSTDGNPVQVYIEAEYIGEPWTHVRELNPLWTIEEGLEIGYDEAEAGLVTLVRGADGTSGKIALPRAEAASGYGDCVTPATVSVKKVDGSNVVTDLTASTLTRWESGYDESGDAVSTFDGSGLLSEGERLLIRYRMEVEGGWSANREARITGSDRCKFACRSACDQFSFCAKSRDGSPPDGLDDFPGDGSCYQTGCSGWEEDAPADWRNMGALINQLFLGVPLVEEQLVAGIPVYVMKRHGVSGLCWIHGMRLEATESGQPEITYPTHGQYGDGAFFLDSLAGTAEYSTAQLASSDMLGPLSAGAGGFNGLGLGWATYNDRTKGHRCLLLTDRIGVAAREGTADSFSGRGPGDRPRVRNYVTAAVHCVHAEDDVETIESGQVGFTSKSDGMKVLRVLPLGTPFEGDGATIATGTVAAASDAGSGRVNVQPANKSTPISWRDTSTTPPFFNTGTADLGAPGNGMVSCHPAFKIKDSGAGQGTGGTQLRGVIPGDWIQFSGVSGDDAAYIEGRKWLVYSCDPFGGGSQGWNFNGTGEANDPPADWTGTRPPNFATWGKKRSLIVLEDDGDGTLAANVANLVSASMTAVSGGVLRSVSGVEYDGVAIDTAKWSVVDPYAGTITVAADGGGSTGEEGWYRITCVAMDHRNLPQCRVFREVVEGIEATEEIEIEVAMSSPAISVVVSAENWHPEYWQASGAELDVSEVDFAAAFMAAATGSYITNEERFYRTGAPLADSGSSTYKLCPIAGESPLVYEVEANDWLVNTAIFSIAAVATTRLTATAGGFAGDRVGAARLWRRRSDRQVRAVPAMPVGVLRALENDAEILSAELDVTIDDLDELQNTITATGVADTAVSSNPGGTTTKTTGSLSLELWGKKLGGQLELIKGIGGLSFDTTSGPDTVTVDVTEIIQTWLTSERGQEEWVQLLWMPGVGAFGGLTNFEEFVVPDRTGTKAAEVTGCIVDSGNPPYEVAVPQDPAVLADNDYEQSGYDISIDGWSVGNLRIKVARGASLRTMRQMFNPSTGARRDVINP